MCKVNALDTEGQPAPECTVINKEARQQGRKELSDKLFEVLPIKRSSPSGI